MTARNQDSTFRPFLEVLNLESRPLVGVEVGVLQGDNAARMLETLSIETLYLVDQWTPYYQNGVLFRDVDYYEQVIVRFSADPRVRIILGDSHDSARTISNNSLDFAYIDANHEQKRVEEDIIAWMPKVKAGGYIAGHDFRHQNPGVTAAVLQAAHKHDWDLHTRVIDWWAKIER